MNAGQPLAEMTLDRSTIYNYIDILEAFGHESLLAEPDIEYTKLRPAVPILKAKGAGGQTTNDLVPFVGAHRDAPVTVDAPVTCPPPKEKNENNRYFFSRTGPA